jgi:hypothetical protein
MKLSEFIILSKEEKRFNVLTAGIPLAKRRVFESMVFLFQLPEFYVETRCSIYVSPPFFLQPEGRIIRFPRITKNYFHMHSDGV